MDGSVTEGKLFHWDRRIYGPALVEAHYIESQVAKYPRIVLSAAVVRHLSQPGHHVPVRRDVDGLYYFDFIYRPFGSYSASLCRTFSEKLLGRMPADPSLDVQAKRDCRWATGVDPVWWTVSLRCLT